VNKLNFTKSLAREAGTLIRQHFMQTDSVTKSDGSLVTAADTLINKIVINAVKKNFPDYAVIGEEESFLPERILGTWVCDPIDGTLPYSIGIPTCVFSLALLNGDGDPVLGVVYDPFLEIMYWATKGGGAYKDGQQLQVNSIRKLDDALVGNSGRSSAVVNAPKFKKYLYARSYRPIILHSVIYESMLVASGKIAATILTGSGAHDAASAKLIVEEAGGKVTSLFGEQQRYDQPINGAIISNSQIHSIIVDLAKTYRL